MGQPQLGGNAKLYYAVELGATTPVWVEITQAIDVALEDSRNTGTIAWRGSDFEYDLPAKRKVGPITFGLQHFRPTTTLETALRDAYRQRTTLQFLVADGDESSADTKGISFHGRVTQFMGNQPLQDGDVIDVSVTVVPYYASGTLYEPTEFTGGP